MPKRTITGMDTTVPRRGRQSLRPEEPPNNLRAIREKCGKTIVEVASYLNVSPVTITQAELKRSSSLGKASWYRLADYFGVDPRVLEGILPIPSDFQPAA